jgi:hypothetical protein
MGDDKTLNAMSQYVRYFVNSGKTDYSGSTDNSAIYCGSTINDITVENDKLESTLFKLNQLKNESNNSGK